MEDISYWMDKLNIDDFKGYRSIESLYDKITTCLVDNITSLIKSRCGTCNVDDFDVDVCLNCPLRNIDLVKLQLKYNEEGIYSGLMKRVKDYCSDICIEDCSKCNLRAIKEDKSLK